MKIPSISQDLFFFDEIFSFFFSLVSEISQKASFQY